MQVSVVIPVYNAARFVRQGVESALMQPETGEVILIEDASSDNSLQICQELADEFVRVRLFRHPDGENHGAGASRNVGIHNARLEYIAFLDADDYFLPDRFCEAEKKFVEFPWSDGIYEAVGYHFENEITRTLRSQKLTTMSRRIPHEGLFEAQAPIGKYGYCPTGGWVIKRSLFDKTGLFDEHLRLHQDTVMYIKFAAMGKMLPGRLDTPVAMRRIHENNRITSQKSPKQTYQQRLLMWITLWKWGKKNLNKSRQQLLLECMVKFAARPSEGSNSLRKQFLRFRQLSALLFSNPELSIVPFFWNKFISINEILSKL